ncbi:uncharacterized protein P884DRAFT_118830 [Thermothelomyces heterothallicus CBS 202.75]|uniref:uncharacterized protein n=1 Tax=Thermothelomyces heterothallicus CBS 202.75 TaxID=1149848 RepID=UPI0037437652
MGGEAAKNDFKGKGKATAADHDEASSHVPAEPTASGPSLSRMAQSAASLLLSGPLGGGPDAEKGDSSRVGEAFARVGESSVRLRPNGPGGASMRTGQVQEHIAQEEASFAAFLDSGSAPMLSEPGGLEEAWQSAVPRAAAAQVTRPMDSVPLSVADQEARDGADVVALLSRDGDFDSVFEHVDESPSASDLSALRQALFGDGADSGNSSPIAWDNVLNFIPEYLRTPTISAPGIEPDGQLSAHLGTVAPDEAWQTWISQWSRVLTSYQDEVWGDLSALVDEARTEIRRMEEVKPGEKPPVPTALLRLRAILGHLREP